jgi:Lon protease-like protein
MPVTPVTAGGPIRQTRSRPLLHWPGTEGGVQNNIVADRIPLFPLHTLLLPNTDLGVHVFEPQYRDLVAQCLGDGEEFGIALIRSGSPNGNGNGTRREAHPTSYDVGTSARVAGYARLPDGRYLLEVEGTRRFHIRGVEANGSYPSATVDWLPEPIGNFARAREASDEVESLVFLYRALGGDGDLPVRLSVDPVARSYQVASLLTVDAPVKQELLEAPTAADRLEGELEILKREIALLDLARSNRR